MSIPKNIEKKHILKAMDQINKTGVPNERQAVKFYLKHKNKRYPTKYVISIANNFANGEELSPDKFSSGEATNNFLRQLGFEVEEKTTNSQDYNKISYDEIIRILQDKIDEIYPRYYDYDVGISKDQWKELLQDPDVFYEENIRHMKCIYSFDNHAATCKEVSGKIGKTPSYYVGLAKGLATRVAKELEIESLPTRDGSDADVYWYILFYGQKAAKEQLGSFEWKLRPNLAYALKELYPELEYPEPAILEKLDDVYSAVWLATALMAYESFHQSDNPGIDEMYFKQIDIQSKAQSLCKQNVESARISQWCNADHSKHTYNYLREGKGKTRRLSYHNEFNGTKEQPHINLDNLILTTVGIKSIKEIKQFVEEDYTALVVNKELTEQINNINCISILDYLEQYAGSPYENPQTAEESKKKDLLNLKDVAKSAVLELDKMAELCSKKFNLKKGEKSKWLTGGNNRVRHYLWQKLKFDGFEDSTTSLSVVAEIFDEEVRFKFTVEINEDKSEKEDYQNHHRLLNRDIEFATDKLFYIISQGQEEIDSREKNISTNEIKQRIEVGTYRKVQMARVITRNDIKEEFEDNPGIIKGMLKAVEALLPYYKLAVGIDDEELTEHEEDRIGGDYMLNFNKNIILYGPPGTGKTYNTVSYAVSIIEKKPIDEIQKEEYQSVFNRYSSYKAEGRIAFTTFHQSYGYEEFIEGIKPVIRQGDEEEITEIQYEYSSGLFKRFCEEAAKTNSINIENSNEPYVFIIDEINRGNISKVFGELITLIEPTKRVGSEESTTVILPYTGVEFGVPNNIYIIGTMNTADRSIALLDTALRRRFKFIEMMPDIDVLTKLGIHHIEGIDIPKMLMTINERISYLYDREHSIGHAYFTSLAKHPSLKTLADIFLNAIIPLLQEYFYEDYNKIQFVLGDNAKDPEFIFILDTDTKLTDLFKGNPDIDLPEKKYTVQTNAFYQAESYIQIY